jgi:predicted AAA+ superfamily ATPase
MQHLPGATRLDLLAPDTLRIYAARPERLRERVLAFAPGSVVVIDEVQKAPELLSVVHSLIEERCGHVFVLTGSSSRKLKHAGVDMLAGRALLRTMHPFMAGELGEVFDLDTALTQGMLPVVWDSPEPSGVLRSYVGTYLREEVRMEGLVRSLEDFSRFLEVMSFSHAQILNTSNVARDCGVERKTVEGYLSVLEDLLLARRLPVFQKRAKRETTQHPKFFLFDAGVFRSLRPMGPLDSPEEAAGPALEGLVHQHLRAWIDYGGRDLDLYYWRTRSGSEIDFVLYGSDGFHAIEVKNSARLRPSDLIPLRTFRQDYPECTPLFLYRGEAPLLIDGIRCLHVDDFLRRLHPERPFPE